jgi:hypothetical protein
LAFNPKDLNAYKEFLSTQQKISETITKGTKSFITGARDARKASNDLKKIKQDYNRLLAEEKKLEEDITKLDGEQQRIAEEKLKVLRAEKKATEDVLKKQEALSKALSSQVKSVKNLAVALGRDTYKALSKVTVKAKELGKEFSEYDDSMRRTAVNIGVVGKQFNQMRKEAYRASLMTQRIGVNAKELVQNYGEYVDEIGRLVPLSRSAGKALAYMAEGTSLGAQGAAQMAASLDNFGMSIETSAKFVEDVVNMSEKMGVNSGKTLRMLQQNLAKTATMNFNGGVNAMAKMAATAVKLKADMSSTLDFAERMYQPEEAIKTAASFQMLGGAIAGMGDGLQLMAKSMFDPEGLQKDMAKAAASLMKFEDGQATISGAAAKIKLKAMAEAAGMSQEELARQGQILRKQQEIGKALSPRMDSETREFIKTIATYDEKSGGFVVKTADGAVKVANLQESTAKMLMSENKTLEKRAEDAQGFMTRIKNLLDSLKNLGFAFFSGLDKSLGPMLDRLTGRGEGTLNDFADRFEMWGEQLGTWISTGLMPLMQQGIPMVQKSAKFVVDTMQKGINFMKALYKSAEELMVKHVIPFVKEVAKRVKEFWDDNGKHIKALAGAMADATTAMLPVLVKVANFLGPGGIFAIIMMKKFPGLMGGLFQRLANNTKGVFNRLFGMPGSSPARPSYVVPLGGGVGGAGGAGGMMMGPGGARGAATTGRFASGPRAGQRFYKVGNQFSTYANYRAAGGLSAAGRFGNMMGAASPYMMLGGMALGIGRQFLDNTNSAAGKAMGMGAGILGGAGTGAMLGSMIGPVGTLVGGVIGGLIGGVNSYMNEYVEKEVPKLSNKSMLSQLKNTNMASVKTGYMADGQIAGGGSVILSPAGTYFTDKKDYITASTNNPLTAGSTVNRNDTLTFGGTIKLDLGNNRSFELSWDQMTESQKQEFVAGVFSRAR